MGECRSRAAELNGIIEGANWEVFEAAGKLSDKRKTAADAIRESVVEAMQNDEHVVQLGPALKIAQSKALRLLTQVADAPDRRTDLQVRPDEQSEIVTTSPSQAMHESRRNLSLDEGRRLLDELKTQYGEDASLRVDIAWRREDS